MQFQRAENVIDNVEDGEKIEQRSEGPVPVPDPPD